MTHVMRSIGEWQTIRTTLKQDIGFIPTMGALHDGHRSLLEQSRRENPITVLSIFVNPTQFNDPNDFEKYPNDIESDLVLAREAGVDYVLIPSANEIYNDSYRYSVDEGELSLTLCGAHRPGHFKGVLTVVMKLLNLVKPRRAYFGEKDYQQLTLVKGMVEAFFMDLEIVACPTKRENSGLALSSRNKSLSDSQHSKAVEFARILRETTKDTQEIKESLEELGFKVDYVTDQMGRRLAAASIGGVRLIDNVPR